MTIEAIKCDYTKDEEFFSSGSRLNQSQPRKESVNIRIDQLEITTKEKKQKQINKTQNQPNKQKEQSIQGLCGNIKQSNICVIGTLEEKRKNNDSEKNI